MTEYEMGLMLLVLFGVVIGIEVGYYLNEFKRWWLRE